jgi:hypothetical protein
MLMPTSKNVACAPRVQVGQHLAGAATLGPSSKVM